MSPKRPINTVTTRPSLLPCSVWSSSSPSSSSPEIWRLSSWCWGRGEGWGGPVSGASLPREFSPLSPQASRPSPGTRPSVTESSSETNRTKTVNYVFRSYSSISITTFYCYIMIIRTRFYCLVWFTLGFCTTSTSEHCSKFAAWFVLYI